MRIRSFFVAIAAMLVFAVPAQARHATSSASTWSAHANVAGIRAALARHAAASSPLAVSRAASTNPQPFTDTLKDSGSAPDVQTVAVSNDNSGTYKIRINVDKLTLPSDVVVLVGIDTDGNPATGLGGIDYVIVCDEQSGGVGLGHWNGTGFDEVAAPTLSATDDAGGITLTINKSDLSNAATINFIVLTEEGAGGAGHEDAAPDSGAYSYTQSPATPLELTVAAYRAPASVKAGKKFVVALVATRNDTLEFVNDEIGGTISCKASVGGKRVSVQAGFVEGTTPELGACVGTAPKKAKKKTITGSITLTVDGASVTKAFAIKVK